MICYKKEATDLVALAVASFLFTIFYRQADTYHRYYDTYHGNNDAYHFNYKHHQLLNTYLSQISHSTNSFLGVLRLSSGKR